MPAFDVVVQHALQRVQCDQRDVAIEQQHGIGPSCKRVTALQQRVAGPQLLALLDVAAALAEARRTCSAPCPTTRARASGCSYRPHPARYRTIGRPAISCRTLGVARVHTCALTRSQNGNGNGHVDPQIKKGRSKI